jgi:hypothetical protein
LKPGIAGGYIIVKPIYITVARTDPAHCEHVHQSFHPRFEFAGLKKLNVRRLGHFLLSLSGRRRRGKGVQGSWFRVQGSWLRVPSLTWEAMRNLNR